nr:copper resistance protein CopC [Novosphingobium sp. AP12]
MGIVPSAASAASGHVNLVAASPAAGSTVAKPTRVTLTFSEPLAAGSSGADLTMTGMPGMANHAPMPLKGFKTTVEGGKVLVLTFPRALPAGSYDLNWHVANAQQHKSTGKYSFSVK